MFYGNIIVYLGSGYDESNWPKDIDIARLHILWCCNYMQITSSIIFKWKYVDEYMFALSPMHSAQQGLTNMNSRIHGGLG